MTEVKKPSKIRKAITEFEAKAQLWELGELSWKLKGKQLDIYNHFKNTEKDITTALCSRRLGKTTVLCTVAIETCLKKPNVIIKYVCPTQKMVENSIKPIIRDLTNDCPRHVCPEWIPSEKRYRFPNGSEIQVAGTDNGNYNSLRGGAAHLCIVDEAGFCDELETVVYSVLAPTTDTTNGKIYIASTPNDSDTQHDFHKYFVFPSEAEGTLLKFTIYDSPLLDEKQINKIIARYPGGVTHPKFRCEYLVEIPKATEYTVVPEFHTNKDNVLIDTYNLPAHYHPYVSMDVGFKDLTAVLFAYYDFREATLYIIDEYVINGPEMTTVVLADTIKAREKELFLNKETNEQVAPYLRVMDNDLKLINDFARLHELYFIPTAKDKKEVVINQFRMWINGGRIKIHKKCKHLIYHVEHAQWSKSKSEFTRLQDSTSGEVRGGHADCLDSALYMVRNISEFANPFPDNFGELKGANVFKSQTRDEKPSMVKDLMNTIMNIRKKNKN